MMLRSNRFSIILLILWLCAVASAQEGRYEIGADMITVLLVRDPSCPLQFREPSKVSGYDNGAVVAEYVVQNVSDWNVESFVIQQTNWLGNEGRTHQADVQPERWMFGPAVTFSTLEDSEPFSLLPLGKETADKLGFTWLKNRILILMVTKVKLANGKTYDVSSKYADFEKRLLAREFDRDTPKQQLEIEMQRTREDVGSMFASSSTNPNQ